MNENCTACKACVEACPEQISISEYHKVPEILDSFLEKLKEFGPNPYKGFYIETHLNKIWPHLMRLYVILM